MVESLNKSQARFIALGLVIASASVARVSAEANIFNCIPANVAGFILFPNIESSNRLLSEFVCKTSPSFDGFDLAELETTAGFAPGTIDLTKPIVIIAERPVEFTRLFSGIGITHDDPDWPVIGFTPRDSIRFGKMLDAAGGERDLGEIGRVAGAYGTFRCLLRDDMVFVSPRRSPLEAIRRATPESSAWSLLSEAARQDALGTSAFVSLSMDQWRNRMQPTILAMSQLIKFGMMMQQRDPARFEETRKLANWFFDGVVSGIDQMKTLSLGFSYDGDRFELAHYHTFAHEGWVSNYLRKVRPSEGLSPWRSIPDQPFLMAAGVDWRVPADLALSVVFNEKCMRDPQLCRSLSLDHRKELDRELRKLISASHHEEFVATSDPGTLHPIRIYGGYAIEDAPKALEMQRRVRERMGELMGGLFPGMGDMGTKGDWLKIGKVRYFQADLLNENLPQVMRDNIVSVYGDDAVYQECAVDDRTIVYAIDQPKGGVHHFIPVVHEGRPALAANRSVTNAMSQMPAHANVVVLIDVQRVALSTPVLIRQGGRLPTLNSDTEMKAPPQVGPLLAWSATVEHGSLTGRFAMDGRDVTASVSAIVEAGRGLVGGAVAPEPGSAGQN